MKKHGLRIAVFILSFAVGIGFVAILNLTIFDQAVSENDANAKTERTDSNQLNYENISNTQRKGTEDIEINFKEFVETENGIAIDFVITNYSSDTYIYDAFGKSEDLELISTIAVLKIDGEEIKEWRCGTGLIRNELNAGKSKILRYFAFNLMHHWKKGKSVQLGYGLRKKSIIIQNYQTFWSENLPISDSIAEKLLKEQTQR